MAWAEITEAVPIKEMTSTQTARITSLIRFLRATRPAKRKRKTPRQRQPDLIRMEYYRALLPFVRLAHLSFLDVRSEIMRAYQEDLISRGIERKDESARDYIKRLIERAGTRAAEMFNPRDMREVAGRFGKRTADFGANQLDRQVNAALGISLSQIEKPVTDKLGAFAQENVDLIVTVHERYFARLERDVMRGLDAGQHPRELAKQLENDYDISERDAERIARDQIGKLNAELNEERVKALGITEYIWRTANDNRVRDEHAELEGERFSYDDPPNAGTDGEPANPGEAIQCRCYAEPAFDQVLGEE